MTKQTSLKPKIGEVWSVRFNKTDAKKDYKITDLSKGRIQLLMMDHGYRNKQWYPLEKITLIERIN